MRKIAKNPWVLGIGTTLIGGVLLSFVLDWINGINLLSTLKTATHFMLNAISAFLNLELKVWWILVAIGLVVVVLLIIVKISDTKSGNKTPPFLNYTKDTLLGYAWEWEYKKDFYDGRYKICNLHPVCSTCGMILKQCGVYGMQMECLRCNKTRQWKESLKTDAQMLIEDNIKKGNYPLNQ